MSLRALFLLAVLGWTVAVPALAAVPSCAACEGDVIAAELVGKSSPLVSPMTEAEGSGLEEDALEHAHDCRGVRPSSSSHHPVPSASFRGSSEPNANPVTRWLSRIRAHQVDGDLPA